MSSQRIRGCKIILTSNEVISICQCMNTREKIYFYLKTQESENVAKFRNGFQIKQRLNYTCMYVFKSKKSKNIPRLILIT